MDEHASRRCLAAGLICGVVALLLAAPYAHAAKPKPPSTQRVVNRLHDAGMVALNDYGMLVAGGYLMVSCQPGTRGDATSKVRWFCLASQVDEVGETVWRSRLRIRAHRGRVRTALDLHLWGVVNLGNGWYVDSEQLVLRRP